MTLGSKKKEKKIEMEKKKEMEMEKKRRGVALIF